MDKSIVVSYLGMEEEMTLKELQNLLSDFQLPWVQEGSNIVVLGTEQNIELRVI